MRKKTSTATAALAEADAHVARVRQAINDLRGTDERLAAERHTLRAALEDALASRQLGAPADAVRKAEQAIEKNDAQIETYRRTITGLQRELVTAERTADAIIRDRRDEYQAELAAEGRVLVEQRQRHEAELARIHTELRPVSKQWQRVERLTGQRFRETDGRDGQVVLDHTGHPVRIGANPVITLHNPIQEAAAS